MQFVNPIFLYGLFALAIPVIIHLFNFRRFKKLYFTNVAFIAELKQETQKQSRLRHWLILLFRMLAVAALVLAFARPFIPLSPVMNQGNAVKRVSIYVDNSFSMSQESEKGMLLDVAKTRAEEIAMAYTLADRFQLLTNDFEGRHQRFVSRDEFLDWVDEVQATAVVKNHDEVVRRLSDLFATGEGNHQDIYVLSDFQKGFLNPFHPPKDSTIKIYWIPLQTDNTDNLYIDSCWFAAPVRMANESVKLFVRVRNASANALEPIPLNLKINDVQKAVSSFDIAAGERKNIEMDFTNSGSGIQYGEIALNDYPIDFDNRFYFSFRVSKNIRVLNIYDREPNAYLNSFYENDSVFIYESVTAGQLDYSSLRDHELIILSGINVLSSGLDQELTRYVDEGGSLAIFPSQLSDLESYNAFLKNLHASTYEPLDTTQQKVNVIHADQSLFRGVFTDLPENMDLPRLKTHFPIKVNPLTKQSPLFSLVDARPFLNVHPIGKGKLYLSAVGLRPEFSNFQQHAIFVPVMYNMALDANEAHETYYVIGLNELIKVRSESKGDQVFKVVSADGQLETIPEATRQNGDFVLQLYDQIKKAGNYTLLFADQPLRGLAFNYDRSESLMDFNTQDELQDILVKNHAEQIQILKTGKSPIGQIIHEMKQGIPLWRWFILAALFFLLAEVLMLRFWKA